MAESTRLPVARIPSPFPPTRLHARRLTDLPSHFILGAPSPPSLFACLLACLPACHSLACLPASNAYGDHTGSIHMSKVCSSHYIKPTARVSPYIHNHNYFRARLPDFWNLSPSHRSAQRPRTCQQDMLTNIGITTDHRTSRTSNVCPTGTSEAHASCCTRTWSSPSTTIADGDTIHNA